MHTLLLLLSLWLAPGFLFVGWRLWMSRPLTRDVHYRERWQYSHALIQQPRYPTIYFIDR
jgi:hypothetical protein